MIVEIAAGVFYLNITDQRGDHRFVDAVLPGFLQSLMIFPAIVQNAIARNHRTGAIFAAAAMDENCF